MFPLKNDFNSSLPIAALSADWLNTVANFINDLDGIGCHVEKPATSGYGGKIVVDGGAFENRHFKISVLESTIRVTLGVWERNGIRLALDCDSLQTYKTLTPGADDYIYLELQRVDTLKNPVLMPDKLIAVAAATLPDDFDAGLVTGGKYRLLGKFTDGVLDEAWKGGDIQDAGIIPDAEWSGIVRATLEFCAEDYTIEKALQLYGVGTVTEDAFSINYFDAGEGAPVPGTLKWAAIDAHNTKTTPTQESLEVKADVLQLFGVDGAADQKTPHVDAFGTPRKLAYSYPALIKETTLKPYLTGDGTGPEGGLQAAQFTVLRTRSGYADLALSVTGTTVSLAFQHTPVILADGRLMFNFDGDTGGSASVDLGSAFSAAGHNHTGTYAPAAHDHDERYWRRASIASETVDFETSGALEAGTFGLYGDADNVWNTTAFKVETVDMVLALSGGLTIDTNAGVSQNVAISGTTLKFHKGIFIGTV